MAKLLATSFTVDAKYFEASFSKVLSDPSCVCLVADEDDGVIGYLLGFKHVAFYANGSVGWVEEIYVAGHERKKGIGRCLMDSFERLLSDEGSKLVSLATRRASDFYVAIGYEESAVYYRKLLEDK